MLSLFKVHLLNAQTDSLPEILFESEEEENSINEWLETLSNNPVDINNASYETIEKIPFLSDKQIDLILQFRPFNKKADVRSLIGEETYLYIRQFIIVKKQKYIPVPKSTVDVEEKRMIMKVLNK